MPGHRGFCPPDTPGSALRQVGSRHPDESGWRLPHCHATASHVYSNSAIYGAVGVFSVICLNGLYFWSANFENFFNRKFLFFFFFPLFSISCLKSQPHVKTLTLTFNDFHFHSNSLIHLTSLLLAYFSCTHTSTFYQCSMAFRGTALWSHTNCHAVTTITEPSALRFFSSRRKETVVVCCFFFLIPFSDDSFHFQNTLHGFISHTTMKLK